MRVTVVVLIYALGTSTSVFATLADAQERQVTAEGSEATSSITEKKLQGLLDDLARQIEKLEKKQLAGDAKQRAAIEASLVELRSAREKIRALRLATRKVDEEKAPGLRATAFTRIAVGLEQAAASAADSQQAFMVDFSLNAPLRKTRNYGRTMNETEALKATIATLRDRADGETGAVKAKTLREVQALSPYVCEGRVDETDLTRFNPSLQAWANFRLTSVPQQVGSEVQAVAIANGVRVSKANELVRGLTFLAGPELRLWNGACFPAQNKDENALFSVWIFAGAGAITPFTTEDRYDIFALGADVEAQQAFPAHLRGSGKKYIAFVPPDRNRFLWQYYLGVRFKTDYLNNAGERQRYPGVIDLAIGRNEAVTGDRNSWVARLEAFYPMPFEPAKFIYVFGGALMTLKKSAGLPALVLNAPSEVVPVPGPDVLLATRRATARDLWRIGVGINLLEAFKGDKDKKKEK